MSGYEKDGYPAAHIAAADGGGAEYFPGPFGDDVGEPLYGALGRAGDEPEDGRDGVRLRKGRFHPTIEGSTANPDLYEKEPLACAGVN